MLSTMQRDMLAAALDRREANSVRERITYDRFRELMDGEGGFVYAGWCGDRGVRGADQGRNKGDDPLPARRGVPLRGGADDCLRCRRSRQQRGAVGEGVLSRGLRPGATARSPARGCRSTASPRRWGRRRTCTARRRCASGTAARRRPRRVPHRIHYTLKANSNLRHAAHCCGSSARAWTSSPVVSCTARARAGFAGRTSSSAASARPTRSCARRSRPACC